MTSKDLHKKVARRPQVCYGPTMKRYTRLGRVGKTSIHDSGLEIFGIRIFFRTLYSRGYSFGPKFQIERVV